MTETPLQTLTETEDIALTGLGWSGLCTFNISQYFQLHSSHLFSIGGGGGGGGEHLVISGSNSIISHTSCWSSFYNSKLKVSP